jgi:hypothetical protein
MPPTVTPDFTVVNKSKQNQLLEGLQGYFLEAYVEDSTYQWVFLKFDDRPGGTSVLMPTIDLQLIPRKDPRTVEEKERDAKTMSLLQTPDREEMPFFNLYIDKAKHPTMNVIKKEFEYVKSDSGALKTNRGKVRWRLCMTFLFKCVAKVLHYGSQKYADHNWRGLHPDDLLDSFFRHIVEHQTAIHELWARGDVPDDGSLPRSLVRPFENNAGISTKDYDPTNPEDALFDQESGLPHLDHAITNLIMYRQQLVARPVQDLPASSRLSA